MSDERPETCNLCGAPVVWCACSRQDTQEDLFRRHSQKYEKRIAELQRQLDEALIDRAQARKLYEEKCIELDKAVLLLITPRLEEYRAQNMRLLEKVKIIRQETVRQWRDLDPKWLMEELDR